MPSFRQKSTSSEFYKNYTIGPIFESGSWEYLGMTRGPTMPPHHMVARQACGRARAWCGAHLALHHFSHLPLPPVARPKTFSIFKLVFLLPIFMIFDLLAQPIFAAELWDICSLLCDSSDAPCRILFGGVFLEYFAAAGDRLSDFACLVYARIISFDACLALLQVAIVVPFI